MKVTYGNEQLKYLCQRCVYWHLSPKDHQIPNHKDDCGEWPLTHNPDSF